MIRPEAVQLKFWSYSLLELDLVQEPIRNKNANEWQVTNHMFDLISVDSFETGSTFYKAEVTIFNRVK